MRRVLALILALTLMGLPLMGGAEEDGPLAQGLAAAIELLFSTHNVTVTGTADFTFEGELFKHAEAKYVQDGTNSFWQLELRTPREGKPEVTGGYTVIANGADVAVMDSWYPGEYWPKVVSDVQDTLLRRSAATDQLLNMAWLLTGWAEPMLGEGVTSQALPQGGEQIRIRVTDGAPAPVNALLNLTAQLALRRYFHIDTDTMNASAEVAWSDYFTRAEALKYHSRSLSLKSVDITAALDAQGRLTGLGGTAEAEVVGADSTAITLGVTFELTMEAYGGSTVETFDPEEWGVELHDTFQGWEYIYVDDAAALASLRAVSESSWSAAGQTEPLPELLEAYCQIGHDGNGAYEVYFSDPDGYQTAYFRIDLEDRLQLLSHTERLNDLEDWTGGPVDEAMAAEARACLKEFLAKVNPARPLDVDALTFASQYQLEDGAVWLMADQPNLAEMNTGINIIIQVQPEWQVVYYSTVDNG